MKITTLWKWVFFIGVFISGARACNVPVFRYALEKWPADPYTLILYHQNDTGSRELQRWLLEHLATADSINLRLQMMDVTTPHGKAAAEQGQITEFPWLQVFFPTNGPTDEPIWSCPATKEKILQVLHSPLRSLLANKILQGDAAIWVLLESGNPTLDAKARSVLQAALQRANRELTIPETGVDINGNPIPVTEFKELTVRFDHIDLVREDAEEAFLVASLLNSEPDLIFFDQPLAFPVMGRGRVLYALVGDGITEENVLEACRSIIGWCSCEIKELNPGVDLLMSADWSHPSMGQLVVDRPPSPIVGLSDFIIDRSTTGQQTAIPKAQVIEEQIIEKDSLRHAPMAIDSLHPKPATLHPVSSMSSLLRNLLWLALLATLLLAVGSFYLLKRKRG